jgi:DNA-binding transcriptional ArsR family regulator
MLALVQGRRSCRRPAGHLTGEVGLAQSTASAHLAYLRDRDMVDARPAGRASVYSLRQPALLGSHGIERSRVPGVQRIPEHAGGQPD